MKKLIKTQNLFKKLSKDMIRSGFIGDTSIPELVWLASFTRNFETPVSLVIFGPSGSGKSFSLSTGLKFVPEEGYLLRNGMSEKALVYSNDLDFRRKHLVIQEAAGMSEGQGRVFIRQLLTEGEITYRTVENIHGELAPRDIKVEGPTGLMMTTTANKLHDEDASRMLSINIAEDKEHIRQVLLGQALGTASFLTDDRLNEWKSHALHMAQQGMGVTIPFATTIAENMPSSSFRVQRDLKQVLSLVKASALLHRSFRDTDKDGQVIATLDDYSHVFRLVSKALSEGMEKSVPDSVRNVVKKVEQLSKVKKATYASRRITQRKLADALGWDRSVVSRNVAKAIDLGYLFDGNPGQGKESDLDLGPEKLGSNAQVIPDPDVLKQDYEEEVLW